jgi:hypothetical protein
MLNKALAAFVAFIATFFVLVGGLGVTESFTRVRLELLGSRLALIIALVFVSLYVGNLGWRFARPRRTQSASPVQTGPSVPPPAPVLSRNAQYLRALDGREIDMARAEDVHWVMKQREPSLWHQAVMAAVAYQRDRHDFLFWVLSQPELDRATAGWIFLWAEGSRYLRGDRLDFHSHYSADEMASLLAAVCKRSEGLGFSRDVLGLDADFEKERLACLNVVAERQLGAGIVPPTAIIGKPFPRPIEDSRYFLDDGLIYVAP